MTTKGATEDEQISDYARIASSFLLVLLAVGWGLNISISPSALRAALTAMAGAQASVLAIVVSVALISVQFVTNSYAPRMADLPFKTDLFKFTFGVFALSIGVDVLLLFVSGGPYARVESALLTASVGGLVCSGFFLYQFIIGMVRQTRPEDLASLYTSTISTEEYVEQSRKVANSPEKHFHPLQPLYRFIMSALSKGEYAIADAVLTQYVSYTEDVVEEAYSSKKLDQFSNREREKLSKPVLSEHLHKVTVKAIQSGEYQIASTATDAQLSLAKKKSEFDTHNSLVFHSLWGFRSTVIEYPTDGSGRFYSEAIFPNLGELTLHTVNHMDTSGLLSCRSTINELTRRYLSNSEPPRYAGPLREMFEDICEAHKKSISAFMNSSNYEKIQRYDFHPDSDDAQTGEERDAIRYTMQAIVEVSRNCTQELVTNGEYPITEANFRNEWADLCIHADSEGAEQYSIRICQIMIEMSVIENLERESSNPSTDRAVKTGENNETTAFFSDAGQIHWASRIAEVREESAGSVVESAFKEILNYEVQDSPPSPIRFASRDEGQTEYFHTELGIEGYRALNQREELMRCVRKLRDKSK